MPQDFLVRILSLRQICAIAARSMKINKNSWTYSTNDSAVHLLEVQECLGLGCRQEDGGLLLAGTVKQIRT